MKEGDILEFNKGGGCLLLFGFPFLLGGLFMLGTAFRLVPIQGDRPPLLVLFLFGFVFTAVGFFVMFAREKTVLRRGQGLVMRGRGFLFLWRWKRERLDDFRRVVLRGRVRHGGKSADEAFAVALEGPFPGKDFVVEESGDYLAARQAAERVARYLRFPLCDVSSGEEVVREPDRLDEAYGERLRRTGEAVAVPEPPPAARAILREEGDRLLVEVPPVGPKGTAALRLIPPLLFAFFALYFFGGVLALPMPEPVRFIVWGVLGLFLGLPVYSSVRDFLDHAGRSERMTLTAGTIRIDRRRGFRWKSVDLPLAEIEDIVLPPRPPLEGTRLPGGKVRLPEAFPRDRDASSPSPGDIGRGIVIGRRTAALLNWLVKIAPGRTITLLTDKRVERFGEGLDPEELAWIHGRIRRYVVDAAGPGEAIHD